MRLFTVRIAVEVFPAEYPCQTGTLQLWENTARKLRGAQKQTKKSFSWRCTTAAAALFPFFLFAY